MTARAMLKKILGNRGYSVEKVRNPFLDQKLLIGDAAMIFDVGGNAGQTVEAYRNVFPHATIHSFEPAPTMYRRLTAKTDAMDNVVAAMIALSSTVGEQKFYEYDLSGYNSFEECTEAHVKLEKVSTIPTSTLDLYCAEKMIENINILKMDIQGAELKALKGATKLLSEGKIDLIYSEVSFRKIYKEQALYHEIASLLAEYDYQLFRLYGISYAPNRAIDYADAVFCRSDLYDRVNLL